MGADSPPDDVGLVGDNGVAVLERRASVICPSHLEDAACAPDAFDAEPVSKPLSAAERRRPRLNNRAEERLLLLCRGRHRPPRRSARAKRRSASRLLGGLPLAARLARAPSESRNSSPESKDSILPASRSASASRSPACHSGDQNQACVASITFWGRSRMPSAVSSASSRSPSSRCAALRISSGRVTWPFALSVVLAIPKS